MSNVYELPNGTRKYREATQWISKLDRGLTDDETGELRSWLTRDPNNRLCFLEVAQLWDNMNALSWLADLFPPKETKTQPRRWLVAAAFVLAVAVAGGMRFFGPEAPQESWFANSTVSDQSTTVYETAIGEQSSIVLSDGSRVVLNTNSELHVRFTKHHRVLNLLRGEVHIEVATDSNRPLSVVVQDKIVQALGTAFGVEIGNDKKVQLVVTEGQVLVGTRPNDASGFTDTLAPVLPASSQTVSEGQELRLFESGAAAQYVSLEEIEVRLSWREGNLIFRGESLEEALREVSKYTTVKFVFLNDEIRNEPIAGHYKAGDVETLLAVLSENVGVAYERTDDGRVLLSRL